MNKIKNGNINGNGEGYSRNWNTEDIMGMYVCLGVSIQA